MINIWQTEWRMAIRQRFSWTFILLWISVLSLLFSLQRDIPDLNEYTNMTGTIANIVLYIVPLFMLIFGSFSIANELENGQWRLLSTYPLATSSYFLGKMAGQFTAQVIVFTLSFGASLAIGLLMGVDFSIKWITILYIFTISLMFFFLLIGLTIGAFVTSRWQALTLSVGVWFFLIMIWPTALIAILNLVPYSMIAPLLKISLFCNPAELLRIIYVVQFGGGAVFGQSYDGLISLLQTKASWGLLSIYVFIYTSCLFILSTWKLERRKVQ